jgi:hypothetical protein
MGARLMFDKKVGMALLLSLALVACDGAGYGSDEADSGGSSDGGTDSGTDTGGGDTDSGTDSDGGSDVSPSLALGTGADAGFTQGEMSISGGDITGGRLSAGGSATVSVNLVNEDDANSLYDDESVTVTFESQCEAEGFAEFQPKTVNTTDGTIETVYTSTDCVGVDTIIARTSDSSAEVEIDVAPKDVGRIGFQGFGGSSIAYDEFWMAGLPSFTTATFILDDGFGNPVKGQTVTFSLQTDIQGEGAPYLTSLTSVADASGDVTVVSNAAGEAKVYVHAGSVGLSVRVLAKAIGVDGEPIDNISSALAVNTGPVHFDGFGLRSSTFAPEVFIEADGGSTVNSASITVSASDKNNNPVADGTVISFWAEYGQIPATCSTSAGGCSVTWTSTGKLLTTSGPDELEQDGRTTILAWTAGEDSHKDSNAVGSNGLFDVGEPLISTPERFLDRDYNLTFSAVVDNYIDYDNSEDWTASSSLFRGYSCTAAAKDAGHCALDVEVWDQVQIIMATSKLDIDLWENSPDLSVVDLDTDGDLVGPVRGTSTFYVTLRDDYGNQAPAGTTISASTESGDIEVLPEAAVPDDGLTRPHIFTITFTEDPGGEPQSPIIIDAVTPSGYRTSVSVVAQVDLPVINVTTPDAATGDFTVSLSMMSGAAVPEFTEVTFETTNETVSFDGGNESEFVIGGVTTFDANFTSDGTAPTKGFATFTATTPDGKVAETIIVVED